MIGGGALISSTSVPSVWIPFNNLYSLIQLPINFCSSISSKMLNRVLPSLATLGNCRFAGSAGRTGPKQFCHGHYLAVINEIAEISNRHWQVRVTP
jgi:hypothetical protein